MCFTYNETDGSHSTYVNGEKVYSVVKSIGKSMFGDHAYIGQGRYEYQSLSGEITLVSSLLKN